jgi:hypothetical protein
MIGRGNGALEEGEFSRAADVHEGKTIAMPLCPPQIPQELP